MPRWNFRALPDSERDYFPDDDQFFEGSCVEHLVRAAIQNSLDAVDDKQGQRVRVRFFLSGGTAALPVQRARYWLGGLDEHLAATKRLPAALHERACVPFLVIEDFGTKGLIGDPSVAWHDEDSHFDNDFYFFWRAIGTTGKRSSARGSWGVGKSTYQQVSAIRTFFGLTVRYDDGRELLMGEARLGPRYLDSNRYDQFCAFGEFGQNLRDSNFVTPIETKEELQRFREDFRLERRSEPGFSCVVPLAITIDESDEAIASLADEFTLAAIHHFAVPLLAGELRVEIGTPSRVVVLEDIKSLRAAINEIDPSRFGAKAQAHGRAELEAAVALAEWSLGSEAESMRVTLINEATRDACQWAKLQIPSDAMPTLRSRFASGQPVAFRVPITVRHKQKGDLASWFDVFVKQLPELQRSSVRFVRQGLTISEVRSGNVGTVSALVVVDRGDLAELLRAAENPAHTTWKREDRLEDRLNHDFIGGESRIGVVVDAPKVLVGRLLESSGEVDYDLLAEFFPLPSTDGFVSRKSRGRKTGTKDRDKPTDIQPPTRPLILTELADGFTLTRNPEVPLKSSRFEMHVAFDTETGNPFSAWEKYDFEIGKHGVTCECAGGSRVIDGNKLTVSIRDDKFRLSVRGFDPERDLAIQTPKWLPDKKRSNTQDDT